jgi:hypothetical protein
MTRPRMLPPPSNCSGGEAVPATYSRASGCSLSSRYSAIIQITWRIDLERLGKSMSLWSFQNLATDAVCGGTTGRSRTA